MTKPKKEDTRLGLRPLKDVGLTPINRKAPEPPAPATQGASSLSEPHSPIAEYTPAHPGGRPPKEDEKKATEKVTAYFTPEQYDKIEELQRAHRKRTKKRISVNELLRRLVVSASLEDILE